MNLGNNQTTSRGRSSIRRPQWGGILLLAAGAAVLIAGFALTITALMPTSNYGKLNPAVAISNSNSTAGTASYLSRSTNDGLAINPASAQVMPGLATAKDGTSAAFVGGQFGRARGVPTTGVTVPRQIYDQYNHGVYGVAFVRLLHTVGGTLAIHDATKIMAPLAIMLLGLILAVVASNGPTRQINKLVHAPVSGSSATTKTANFQAVWHAASSRYLGRKVGRYYSVRQPCRM